MRLAEVGLEEARVAEALMFDEPQAVAPVDPGRQVESLDHELKFTFSNSRAVPALAWLRAICRPDPEHPFGIVSSLYYDTRDFRSLGEKLNSDYLKMKVRLRWYVNAAGLASGSCLEAKYRIGGLREKVRIPIQYEAAWLDTAPLQEPTLETVPLLLRPYGVRLSGALSPMFVIRYERHRFLEPASGTRVCLDTNIYVPAVNPQRLSRSTTGELLPTGVLEVKGRRTELPAALTGLLHLGCRKASYSKYSACYRHLARGAF